MNWHRSVLLLCVWLFLSNDCIGVRIGSVVEAFIGSPAVAPVFSNCGVESNVNWVPWSEDFETDLPVVYPQTTDEVKNIVSTARNAPDGPCRVRPVGTSHSVDGVVAQKSETNVIVTSLADYEPPNAWNKQIILNPNDPDDIRVRMSAGATQLDFIKFIRSEGYTCRTCTVSPFFTLGGVYMNPSVHGGTLGEDRYASLLTGVLAIDGQGNEIEVLDEDDIRDWRGSMGLLGIVLAVEIAIQRDEGRQKVGTLFQFEGDDWNRDTITTAIRDELDGKEYIRMVYNYYTGEIFVRTLRTIGADQIDLEMAAQQYKKLEAQAPDLAKTGGGKSLNDFFNLGTIVLGGKFIAGLQFSSLPGIEEGTIDGFISGFDEGPTRARLQAFIPCPDDCIDDGRLFDLLNVTKAYFDANGTRAFPSFNPGLRFIDVAPLGPNGEPMMTLEYLQPGTRYISIDHSEPRFDDDLVQPFGEFLQGLQEAWDALSNFQAGFHVGKIFGYGPLKDSTLQGVYPFQDQAINDRFFPEATRKAFMEAIATYDPDGIFAAGSGLRLLGIEDAANFDVRRSSFQDGIAVSSNCKDEQNGACLSECCEKMFLFQYKCTAINDLPGGADCDVDCNCASGHCKSSFLFWNKECAEE